MFWNFLKKYSLFIFFLELIITQTFFRSVADDSHKVSPYTLPWQLRPIVIANAVRIDSAIASYKNKSGTSNGLAGANVLTGIYKLNPDLALVARLGLIKNYPPSNADSATSFLNPLFGITHTFQLADSLRMGLFLGLTIPIGTGGGNLPNVNTQSANSVGILARSAMDNALFAVNYFTLIPGISIAYLANNLTLQYEATLLQLTRVRGELLDRDASRTNFTSGLALGYAVAPLFSVLSELKYQRWIHHPTVSSSVSPAIENLSIAIGPRFTFVLYNLTFKPGVAYVHGLAGAMANGNYSYPSNSYQALFFDLPITF